MENWRSMGTDDKAEFLACVKEGLEREWAKGQQKYQSHIHGFQGDPLTHAIEEALNLLCYLWVEQRRQRGSSQGDAS